MFDNNAIFCLILKKRKGWPILGIAINYSSSYIWEATDHRKREKSEAESAYPPGVCLNCFPPRSIIDAYRVHNICIYPCYGK